MTLDDELVAWLRLAATPGVSRRIARALLTGLGDPRAVFQADDDTLAGLGAAPALIDTLRVEPPGFAAELDTTARWLAGADATAPRTIVTLADAAYPPGWLQSPDPPLRVYVTGDVHRLSARAVAVVGSRHPTPQGLDHARDFARGLGERGWCVVSGLALGIDAAAHDGALGTDGRTVAVTGCGPDVVYPSRHRALAERIAALGAIVTEHPPLTPPLPAHFPQRNRLIASLARGTLVVEAAVPSGSLITARLALEVGADVFAIPGSIRSPQSQGCHALIQQGAKLVTSVDDILSEFGEPGAEAAPPAPRRRGPRREPRDAPAAGDLFAPSPTMPSHPAPPASAATVRGEPDALLDALGWEPMSLDELAARTGRSAADLGARLLELELDGRVRRLPGQLFQRSASA
jgi:DNA processing protein